MSKNLHDKLNEYLANQQIMYIKLHNLHRYMKGRSFFTLHAKLEELYDTRPYKTFYHKIFIAPITKRVFEF